MVRAKANKISGSDDALVKRLQREVQHLRDILNIRRKGGQGELAEQLLLLKVENNKLKEKNLSMKDVENIMQENKNIKVHLQKLMSNNTHDNFHNDNNEPIDVGDQNSNFFMTEYNMNNGWNQGENIKSAEQYEEEPSKQDILFKKNFASPISIESSSMNKENYVLDKDMMNSLSSFKKTNHNGFSPRETDNTANEMFPSLYPKPALSTLLEKRLSPPTSTKTSSNINKFQLNSSYLKDNLSKSGRCPICTLPIPCKHYESMEQVPVVSPQKNFNRPPISKYSLPVSAQEPMSPTRSSRNSQTQCVTIENHTATPKNNCPFNRALPQISPRMSQMDSFLDQGIQHKKKRDNPKKDFNLFMDNKGQADTRVRIRGRSNIVQTQEGSLMHSIREQREEVKRQGELKNAKK